MSPAAAPARKLRPSTAAARRTAGPARRLRRAPAPRVHRRVSGPARPLRPALAGAGAGTAAVGIGIRVWDVCRGLPERRLVYRLVRGHSWIAVLAAMLIGIVFIEVSLLKMNAGIGRAMQRSAALERTNGDMRAQVSRLEAEQRVQTAAGRLGLQMPAAADVHYLNALPGNAAAAAAMLRHGSWSHPTALSDSASVPTSAYETAAPTDQSGATATDQQALDTGTTTAAPDQTSTTPASAPPTQSTPAPAQPAAPAPATAATAAGGATAPTP